ncbi:ABC transporter permease [Sphingopyxis panaciterrulae]|uniref:Putative spermidine/putrescine transport system permease protein n=1 Tax=Sphingopyxis panaciterrulae TaxID=462372 RepID=A0A7W9ERT7_9SPHN|nr:ABC transporter permease [Sphingopyxis panaciterrulae]MBB5708043.1 putative spermidine/putrescine transport system permease protein [Sphingopyxis panaciterrulae]
MTRRWVSFALIAPLLAFLIVSFIVPVLLMLARAVTDRDLDRTWPASAAALRTWDGEGLPPDALARTVAREMLAAHRAGTLNRVANRLNYDLVGSRSLLYTTADRLAAGAPGETLADLARIDRRWARADIWTVMRHADGPLTSYYLLAALDRRIDTGGHILRVPREQAVFVDIFLRTFKIASLVALFCALLGYPVAYLLASLPRRIANPLLILVLLPFWTSALVRTAAWAVLLQTNGVVNDLLQYMGLVDAPVQLIYNRLGVYVAMTHVLLPFFILPLYGVMKGIDPTAMRAASSLGAPPLLAFLKVYLPQSLPGVAAGAVLVFTLAVGYYVTPALVGGGADQMISASIAFYTSQSLNWGMAAALSLLLLLPLLLMLFAGRTMVRTVPA